MTSKHPCVVFYYTLFIFLELFLFFFVPGYDTLPFLLSFSLLLSMQKSISFFPILSFLCTTSNTLVTTCNLYFSEHLIL